MAEAIRSRRDLDLHAGHDCVASTWKRAISIYDFVATFGVHEPTRSIMTSKPRGLVGRVRLMVIVIPFFQKVRQSALLVKGKGKEAKRRKRKAAFMAAWLRQRAP